MFPRLILIVILFSTNLANAHSSSDSWSSSTSTTSTSSSSSSSYCHEKPTEPLKCCFKDQVLSTCYNKCSENTCANVRNPPKFCTLECHPNRCVCKNGLYKNECNQCVTKDKCKKICEPKEALHCGNENEVMIGCFDESKARICPTRSCKKSTNVFKKTLKPNHQCILNKCDCIEGFLRNKCGKCVPEKDCNKRCSVKSCDPCSGPNEVRVKKFQQCTARTCENYIRPVKCRGEAAWIQFNICDCIEGYRRDKCGRCIPKTQCYSDVPCKCLNPCVDPNEEWQFGNDCLVRTCQNLYELPLKLCINTGYYSCDCSSSRDLWRNDMNQCVPRDQCPPPKQGQQPIEK